MVNVSLPIQESFWSIEATYPTKPSRSRNFIGPFKKVRTVAARMFALATVPPPPPPPPLIPPIQNGRCQLYRLFLYFMAMFPRIAHAVFGAAIPVAEAQMRMRM
ncbi:hypothetical protein H0H87_002543 [Tephrocybe sp. NHM501043]|nr:hypothetical protein H0H87_002543 [Tephrocybe sp. NHM501043]